MRTRFSNLKLRLKLYGGGASNVNVRSEDWGLVD